MEGFLEGLAAPDAPIDMTAVFRHLADVEHRLSFSHAQDLAAVVEPEAASFFAAMGREDERHRFLLEKMAKSAETPGGESAGS